MQEGIHSHLLIRPHRVRAYDPAPAKKRKTSRIQLRRVRSPVSLHSRRGWLPLLLGGIALYIVLRRVRPDSDLAEEVDHRPWFTALSERQQGKDRCSFQLSADPRPVHFEKASILYDNHPGSVHRPDHQFHGCVPPEASQEPVLLIISTARNPGEEIVRTASNVLAYSLRNLRWLIVDDRSDDEDALARLQLMQQADRRIKVIHPTQQLSSQASAFNLALEYSNFTPGFNAPFLVFLRPGDLLELTALEKAIWTLTSNRQFAFTSYHQVITGPTGNTTNLRGPHSGLANYYAVSKPNPAATV